MKTKFLGLALLAIILYLIGCDEPKKNEPAPPIIVEFPENGSNVNELVTIIVQVHDINTTGKVEFFIDDSLHFTDTELPYQFEWNTVGYKDSSEHTIKVISYDNLGTVIGSDSIKLIVDNTSSYPLLVTLFRIIYENESFIITWSSSTDIDFSSYELYESHSMDMSESSIVYFTENKLDTSYIVAAVSESEKRYYQVVVKDFWDLQSESNIQIGNSYIMFMRTFGGEYEDVGYSVQQTSDGGYIITGSTRSFGNGGRDVWLIKTDANGNELWNKTFGNSETEYSRCVIQTNDGGYIITGYSGSGVWLIKTDQQGSEEWNKTLTNYFSSAGLSVIQTLDGGFIVTGRTKGALAGSPESDLLLVKTDSQGNEEWHKSFGGDSGEVGYSVQQTNDGGFIITGNKVRMVWLIKTDSEGNEEWEQTFEGDYYSVGRSVQKTLDGGYIIAGSILPSSMESDVWLIKTDANGNEEWNSIFVYNPSTGWFQEGGYSVVQTLDGGYIITGCINCSSINEGDLWLIKTDSQGNSEWTRAYNIYQDSYEVGYSVQQTNDGGYIIVGQGGDYFHGNILLIKTDQDGTTIPFGE